MRAEDIARQNQFREGYRLVDYGEAGLPIFRLTIEAVTMAKRVIPTIHEFVMRCLAIGENRELEIAGMLGLQPTVVQAALNVLIADHFVTRRRGRGNDEIFKLTETGEARLRYEGEEVPQEEMLVIDYDGTRRCPIRLTGETVVRASELKWFGAVEIRPDPADAPTVDELNIPEVTKVIRRYKGEDFHRNILALKSVARRSFLFREVTALVFASENSTEVQIAFAIDGKISAAHERAFAERSGPKKMGFVQSVNAIDRKRAFEKLVGKAIVRMMPETLVLKAARKEEADAVTAFNAIRPVAERIQGRKRETDPVVAQLVSAEERLQFARHTLDSFEVRPLACFEQYELLDEALKSAHSSLLITTAGVQPVTLNSYRLRGLDILASAGVQIEIVSLLTPQSEPRGRSTFDPLVELTKRAQKGKLSLRKGTQPGFYFLIKDDDLAVISNRPFLGEITRRSGFICVEGLVTRRRELVQEVRQIALSHGEKSRVRKASGLGG